MMNESNETKCHYVAQLLSRHIGATAEKRIHNTKLGDFYEKHPGAKDFVTTNGGIKHLCESYPKLLVYYEDPESRQTWIYTGRSVKQIAPSTRSPNPILSPSPRVVVPYSSHPATALTHASSYVSSLLPKNVTPKDVTYINDRTRPGNAAIIATYEEVESKTETVRPNYDVVVCVDISGSMSGKKSEQAVTAIKDIFGHLKKKDKLAVVCFNNRVRTAVPLGRKKDLSFPGCIEEHLESYGGKPSAAFKCSGGTALWDSIDSSMEILRKRDDKSSHPFLIVLTDGEEQHSKVQTTSSIQTMLFNPKIPNFHCSFITVGADHDQHVCTMRDMAAGKPHLYHLNAENADAIGGCFRKVVIKFDQIVTKEVKVSVETTETCKRVPKNLSSSHSSSFGKAVPLIDNFYVENVNPQPHKLTSHGPRSNSAPRHGRSSSISHSSGFVKAPALPNNLYVENLDSSVNEHNLNRLFGQFGTITSSKVITNKDGTSRGIAFVAFSTIHEARRAIAAMNGAIVGTSCIAVSFKDQNDSAHDHVKAQTQVNITPRSRSAIRHGHR